MIMLPEIIAELGVDAAIEYSKNKIDEARLKSALIEAVEGQKKYHELASLTEEFDFDGLINYVKDHLVNELDICLFNTKPKERGKARGVIFHDAIVFSQANSEEAKRRVIKCIGICLDIYNDFYRHKLNKGFLVIENDIVDGVTENVREIAHEESNYIVSKIQGSTLLSLDKVMETVKAGKVADIGTAIADSMKTASTQHPLYPYYGYDYAYGNLKSIPLIPEAKEKYPEKYTFSGRIRVGEKYFGPGEGNPFDYSYRHQLKLVMEVSTAKKYLGDMLDPIQEEAEELENKEIEITPPQFPRAFPCQLRIGNTTYFDYILLRTQEIEDDGTLIINNREQGGHLFFEVKLNPKSDKDKLDFKISMQDADYRDMLVYWKFIRGLKANKDLHIYVLNEATDLAAGIVDADKRLEDIKEIDDQIDLLERICDIEKYAEVKFDIVECITKKQYNEIVWISNLIRNDKVESNWKEISLHGVVDENFRQHVLEMDNIEYAFSYVCRGEQTLLGVTFELDFARYFKDARFADLDKVKQKINVLDDGDEIKFKLVAGKDSTMVDTLNVPQTLVDPEIEILET